MPRQSITLTTPNDNWLKEQSLSGEYQNKSEVINTLIREARKVNDQFEWIRDALQEGEQSGVSPRTPEDIREAVKKTLEANGQL